jgi:hypothetical protein
MDLQNSGDESRPYQIIESPGFAHQLANLVPNERWRDDLIKAFYSELPTDPEKFERVPGTRLRAATVHCAPPLTLYFTIENRIIELIEIHPFS